MPPATQPALLCLSHLRWDFVYQRPNHLMARAARDRRVYFVEEAVEAEGAPRMDLRQVDGVTVVRPEVPADLTPAARNAVLESLLSELVEDERLGAPWVWYYTPMALPWARGIDASAVIYDCMDELSGFRGAPAELVELERELFRRADVVFTGGRSLGEVKSRQHHNVHALPSSVEIAHFASARRPGTDPEDQASIPGPRIGYYGVIDERLDTELISEIAARRPEWQIVLVGPVAKLAPEEVPSGPNIHHLGMKRYGELPDYLRGWDVAIMPFARNEATRFISPTKTPEYLAGGRPVVSTSIRDVVEPYGRLDLVRIADTADGFVAAIEDALEEDMPALLSRADGLLAEMSWDATWARMDGLVRSAVGQPAGRELVPVGPGSVVLPPRPRPVLGTSIPAALAKSGLAATKAAVSAAATATATAKASASASASATAASAKATASRAVRSGRTPLPTR